MDALATAWVAIADADDLIVAPSPIGPNAFSDLAAVGWPLPRLAELPRSRESIPSGTLVPWGWTRSMSALAAERGWSCASPPLEVVRQINSRRFRFELETALGIVLPGAALAGSVEELQARVSEARDAPLGWIVKSNFGMAGRESIRGRGAALSEPQLHWAQRRIVQAGPVVFEPMVDSLAEAGVQIEIPMNGDPLVVGVTPLLVDRSGTYRGSRFGCRATDVNPWQSAIDVALRVAEEVQRLGYFGPLGIDAMCYRTAEGEPCWRALQDLNARFTMGRLVLGFKRLVPEGWCASWLHAPHRASAFMPTLRDALQASERSRAQLVMTSPDGADTHHSLLLLADSAAMRERLETMYFRECAAPSEPPG